MQQIIVKNTHQCPKLPWMVDFHKTGDVLNCQLKAAYEETYIKHLMHLNDKSKVARKRLTQLIVHIPTKTPSEEIEALLFAGMTAAVLRIEKMGVFETERQLESIKQAVDSFSNKIGRVYPLAVAFDIPSDAGIRTGRINKNNSIRSFELEKGQTTKLTANKIYANQCSKEMIYVDCDHLEKIIKPGDSILLDGEINLSALEVAYEVIECLIERTGIVSDNVSVTLPNTPVTLPSCTELQEKFLHLAVEQQIDLVFIGHDLFNIAKEILGGSTAVILKLDSGRFLDDFDEIVEGYDGVLLDCDSLLASQKETVFLTQKSIAAKCNTLGKPVINVLYSHEIYKSFIFDIANSVLDGCDAMLLVPNVEVIEAVSGVCKSAEMAVYQKQLFENLSNLLVPPIEPILSVAVASVEASFKTNAAAILLITSTGRTAKLLAKFRPRCPIIALTRFGRIAKQLMVYKGVIPFFYVKEACDQIEKVIQMGMTFGKVNGYIRMGDAVVVAFGVHHALGYRNCVEVVYASEYDTVEDTVSEIV